MNQQKNMQTGSIPFKRDYDDLLHYIHSHPENVNLISCYMQIKKSISPRKRVFFLYSLMKEELYNTTVYPNVIFFQLVFTPLVDFNKCD